MFSDLVGSTALSARMDPEDLREVISAHQRCVAETVRRFGGFVAKYMGDGVLIYFGYRQAHEDDAERAVRAALEAIASVGALKLSVPLQTRIGIATGLVVVGDLIGSGEAYGSPVLLWARSENGQTYWSKAPIDCGANYIRFVPGSATAVGSSLSKEQHGAIACGQRSGGSRRNCDGACTNPSPSKGLGLSKWSEASSPTMPCRLPTALHWEHSTIM
jgi:hypothetical protein